MLTTQEVTTVPAQEAVRDIVLRGGPEPEEYILFEECLAELFTAGHGERPAQVLMEEFMPHCGFLQDKLSLMGHIRCKPYGYAGDFEVIDRIYQNQILDQKYQTWDRYSLQHPAAQAVRNRKSYFKSRLGAALKTGAPHRLLNLASGPARDLMELYNELIRPEQLHTTCVEMDPQAIAYAQQLNAGNLEQIEFIRKNVFRYQTAARFDTIWSAGLFDYFNDKTFVLLLSRFGDWLEPGGEIIIGNFNSAFNPSRLFMEVFGDWHLNHRTAEELISLAEQAGYARENIHIGREPENINLFLHIRS
ncbi:class I SAM-dependent methyltransferase [Pedobacter sp. SYP-B3415]|uniref:class I SAM-dependent methyltransferase n=1 Tax=Pedobacter sp. SYP-B3415 TaxID=2496641 RepID=UPI00101B868C|nr:class I SAM-dependent methyltransferase [Pedobacter sp. SYP-B3415]